MSTKTYFGLHHFHKISVLLDVGFFGLLWFLLGIKLIQNAVELHMVTMMEKNTNGFVADVFSREKKGNGTEMHIKNA